MIIFVMSHCCSESSFARVTLLNEVTKEDSFNFNQTFQTEFETQVDSAKESKTKAKKINSFPFNVSSNGGQFLITVDTEGSELYPKYFQFFNKYGYSGNGYCWEGLIKQILEKLNPELLKHIDFDPEAGAFFASADSKENQTKFIELLSPIFADFNKLEKYVSKADRSRIDD